MSNYKIIPRPPVPFPNPHTSSIVKYDIIYTHLFTHLLPIHHIYTTHHLLIDSGINLNSIVDDSIIGNNTWRDDFFAQLFQDFLSVIIETTVNLFDGLILDNPQLAVGLSDQTLIVSNDDHTWKIETT